MICTLLYSKLTIAGTVRAAASKSYDSSTKPLFMSVHKHVKKLAHILY